MVAPERGYIRMKNYNKIGALIKMKEVFKVATASLLAGLAMYLHSLFVPLAIFVTMMFLDYSTGLTAAWVTRSLSSHIGVLGIVKKCARLIIVVVGIAVDWTVTIFADGLGVSVGNFAYFSLLIIIWLTLNECISIVENIEKIGVPVPTFILKAVKRLANKAESSGDKFAEDKKENEDNAL